MDSQTSCRLVIDLAQAIESGSNADRRISGSEIAKNILHAARSKRRLTTCPAYDFKTLRDAILDAQVLYQNGDVEYPSNTGQLLKIKATAMVIVALGSQLTPGRDLHELLLGFCAATLGDEWRRIDLSIDEDESCDLYEAALRKDLDTTFAILESRFLIGE